MRQTGDHWAVFKLTTGLAMVGPAQMVGTGLIGLSTPDVKLQWRIMPLPGHPQ